VIIVGLGSNNSLLKETIVGVKNLKAAIKTSGRKKSN